jgi:hypothetical protein
MATRKVRKKKPVPRGRFIVVRIGKKVYSAPFSALGRDFADQVVLTKIYALEKKSCCHRLHFAGVFGGIAYDRAFGNGRFPPH